jgi:hypothetical protein
MEIWKYGQRKKVFLLKKLRFLSAIFCFLAPAGVDAPPAYQ